MKNKFSKLEKDDRTFSHVLLYYVAIVDKKSLMPVDMLIQERELKEHLKRCRLKETDLANCTNWIEDNHEAFRAYINTLKAFTLFIYMENRLEYREKVIWEIFCRMVDVFNEEKDIIMETIRLQ